MLTLPDTLTLQVPTIDNITVQYDTIRIRILKKMINLVDLTIFCAQMNVRQDNCFKAKCNFLHFGNNYGDN